jgi:hypothetical protein
MGDCRLRAHRGRGPSKNGDAYNADSNQNESLNPHCRFPLRFDPGFPLRSDPAFVKFRGLSFAGLEAFAELFFALGKELDTRTPS